MDDVDAWWRRGVCAEIGSDLFFVGTGESNADAKQACNLCPVRLQCLADAIQTEVSYGVFGGLSAKARRPLGALVRAGEDPQDVALRAIEQERRPTCRRPTRSRASSSALRV